MRYEEYKPTGIAWIEFIPATWEHKKISALFSQRKRKVSDTDYPALSVAKIGVVPQLANAAKSNDSENRKLVCAGDFVINSRSDRKSSCGVAQQDGSVSLINIVLTPRQEWNSRYVHYLLRSQPFSEEYYRYGRGIVSDLWTTRYSEMKNILLPVPPRKEQDQIVRYLDWQVSKLNALIAAKKHEINLLEEERQALIDTFVLRSLHEKETKVSSLSWDISIPLTMYSYSDFQRQQACQMCQKPTRYFEAVQLEEAPKLELEQMHICLCPACATKFREYRRNHPTMKEFYQKSIDADCSQDEPIVISIGNGQDICFTQTHLAEIQQVMYLQGSNKK